LNVMYRTYVRQFVLVLAACLFLAGCGEDETAMQSKVSFEIDQPFERGPLTGHVRVEKSTMTIAETVLVEFEATVENGYEVTMPNVGEVLTNFGIVDWQNLGQKLDPNDNVVTTYRYRLEPFVSGKYELPAFTFEFHDVNDVEKKHELETEPIELEVTSLLGEDRENLTIQDIEGVVEIPKEASLWWLWALGAMGVVGALVLWLVLRKKHKAALIRIFKPAHEIAYARLRVLVKEDLLKAGKIKEFYERISSILRHYIEDRFELRAPERTTEEFLAELKFTRALSESQKADIEEFLTLCDLVKFAKHAPTAEQVQRTFTLVKEFIEKTRSDERKIDVTDRVNKEETVTAEAG